MHGVGKAFEWVLKYVPYCIILHIAKLIIKIMVITDKIMLFRLLLFNLLDQEVVQPPDLVHSSWRDSGNHTS